MGEYTFYFKNNIIVAMSYPVSRGGYKFCEGSLFKNRNSFLMGNGFAASSGTYCENLKELRNRVKRFEKKMCTTFNASSLETKTITANVYSQDFIQFREKYGK